MAAKKKAVKKKSAAKPRQEQLPGMKDRKLAALHDAALSYAEIRDQRQTLTQKESELKKELLGLMHKSKRQHYEYGGVEVDLVVEKETVKVRIKKAKAEDAEPPEQDEVEPPETDAGEEEEFEGDPTEDNPEEELDETDFEDVEAEVVEG